MDCGDIEELKKELQKAACKTTLVEGPSDKRSLESLGFQHVITLDRALFEIVELLENEKEIIILTDLDTHGIGLYKYFYTELTKRGVHVNNQPRLLIMQTPVKHIEGLATYLEHAQ